MLCPKCGKKIEGEPKICPGCGKDIFYIWQQSGIKELWGREDAMFSLNAVRRNMFMFSGLMILGFVLAVSGIITSNVALIRLLFTGIILVLATASLLVIGYFRLRMIHLKKKSHS
ncbi:MAG: zinc ribbon domain-containing protein [Candidatus Thermoplasmatota archaeon]|nr:zinc ribbon domain-containing protein [Candidatus Thermoplasmatota archaeon]